MPIHRQKKDTTSTTPSSMQEQTVPALPDQQTFQQYLRELARGALRVVLEEVMREELDALIGVGWGESSRQQQWVSQRLLQPRLGHHLGSDRGRTGPARS
jgi:putative transposase